MKNTRLYHTVADQMKKLISDGSFPPGSRLPGERDLAERFKVSRVTIREAEIALQALGYLQVKTGSGVYVLDPADKDSDDLPDVTAFELTEARSMFESEAAALAARQIDNDALAHLEDLLQRMSSTDPADEEDSQLADREFHLTIAAASGNAAVRYVVQTLWKMRTELEPVREVHAAICAKEDARNRDAEHAEILKSLKEGDPAGARTAMQRHFRHLLASMIDITEEQAMEELRQRATESRERYLKRAPS